MKMFIWIITYIALVGLTIACDDDDATNNNPESDDDSIIGDLNVNDSNVVDLNINDLTTDDTSTCIPGTLNCTCAGGSVCETGLICQSGTCMTDTGETHGLVIATTAARACELLFTQQQGAVLRAASYGAETHGALRRRDPNVAVAIARASDTPFNANSVALVIEGDHTKVLLRKVRCFDASGDEITNANVTLQ